MLPFRKIIFPVDYSDACRAVIPHVRKALEHFSSQLTLVHAYGAEGLSFVDLPLSSPDLPTQVREFEQLRLRDFAQEEFPGVTAECYAELGEAGGVIHEVIRRQGGDLVMMPTHGRGPVRRLMLGSVTTKLLHDVSCALWTATGAAVRSPVPKVASIVCAVDATGEAAGLIQAGAALAKSYGAKLAVVHVLGLQPMPMEVDFVALRKELLVAAEAQLRNRVAEANVQAAHEVIEGSVADTLHDCAARHNADLLIVGRGHAQDAVGRVWSNLYSIVRESPCPVLSI